MLLVKFFSITSKDSLTGVRAICVASVFVFVGHFTSFLSSAERWPRLRSLLALRWRLSAFRPSFRRVFLTLPYLSVRHHRSIPKGVRREENPCPSMTRHLIHGKV